MIEAYGRMTKERVFAEGQLVLKVADYVKRGMAGPSKFAPKWEGRTPCDKGGSSKWILPFDSNGWQRLNGSHQWEMAETLLCLGRKVMWLSLSFVLLKSLYVSFTPFFFSFQVTMSQDRIVTCFHDM